MKNWQLSLRQKVVLVAILLTQHLFIFAQKTAQTTCKNEIKQAQQTLQTEADAGCRTAAKVIVCPSSTPGAPAESHTLVAQPAKSAACSTHIDIQNVDANGKALLKKDKKPAFEAYLIQSVCFNKGVSLEVWIPNRGADDGKTYSYLWEIDGNKGGHQPRLSCVTGNTVTVRVSNNQTGASVYLSAKISKAGQGISAVAKPKPTAPAASENDKNKDSKEAIDFLVAAYQKTACFGQCPVYTVRFYSSGRVEYHGEQYVQQLGKVEKTVTAAVIEGIRQKAIDTRYFDAADYYPVYAVVADAAATVTYVKVKDREKQVTNVMEAPDNVLEFERHLEQIIKVLGFKIDLQSPTGGGVKQATPAGQAPKN